MREGWWINYDTGKDFLIPEHETWVRNQSNAKSLGIPNSVIKNFGKFKPQKDRDNFLVYLMKEAPVMRVRGHGTDVTFEYYSHNREAPLRAVLEHAQDYAGPFSMLNIHNLATREFTSIQRNDFETQMDEGGPEAVMRAASLSDKKMVGDLLRTAKEIIEGS